MSSRSQRVADVMRTDDGRLDDIRRARMERDLVAAWKHRTTARIGERSAGRRGGRRLHWAASVAVSGLIGGMVVLYGAERGSEPNASAATQATPAYFEVRIGDAATQTGLLVEGQTLASGGHGQVQVHVGATQIDVARESRLRFERISDQELRVALTAGEINVAYHPARPGQQRLSVETASARVLVVGTEFVVSVDPSGATDVRVTEGVVRVMSRSGLEDRVLTAGDKTRVEATTPEVALQELPMATEPTVFAADLDFGESPEAIDIARLVTTPRDVPSVRPSAMPHVPPAGAASREAISADEVVAANVDRMTPARRLELARALLRQGRHDQARTLLRVLTEGGQPVAHQVEAWTLTAESYTAQGYVPRAADSYRKAADVGRHTQAGHNAVFAWARLLERHTRDQQAAVLVYERYLREAPEGALALQTMDALCRLGVMSHCQ